MSSTGEKRWCLDWIRSKPSPHLVEQRLEELYQEARHGYPENGCFLKPWLLGVLQTIDRLWYDNQLMEQLRSTYKRFEVHLDKVPSTEDAAFVHEPSSNVIALHINRSLFNGLFRKKERGYHSGGLLCQDRLKCFLYVLLHETVHLLLTLCDRLGLHDDTREHGQVFRAIVKRQFSQTDTQHGLIDGYDQTHDLNRIKVWCKTNDNVEVFINGKWQSGSIQKRGSKWYHVRVDDATFKTHVGLLRIPSAFQTVTRETL